MKIMTSLSDFIYDVVAKLEELTTEQEGFFLGY